MLIPSEKQSEATLYKQKWLEAIGMQLASERKRQGMTVADIATKLGVSIRTVGYIESGKNNNTENMLAYCYVAKIDFFVIVARARLVLQANEVSEDNLLSLLKP